MSGRMAGEIAAAQHAAEQSQAAERLRTADRGRTVGMAKICQEVERWGEMLEHVSAFRGFAGALTPFERKLLHTAFAGKVSHLFKSLHAARGVAAVAVEVGDKLEAECAGEYCSLLEAEIRSLCQDALTTVEDLFPRPAGADRECGEIEEVVFHWKMVGDFQRYLAQACISGDGQLAATVAARMAYGAAHEHAAELGVCHPTRLGLGLNLAALEAETLGDIKSGVATANETLLASVDGMDALTDENFDESTQIMARLQAALEKWTSGQWNDEVEERTPTSGWGQGFVDHARRAEYGVGM